MKEGLRTGAVAQSLGVCQPTIRKYARKLGIDYSIGFKLEDVERLKIALTGKREKLDEMTISQLAKHMLLKEATLRRYVETRKLGRKNANGILALSEEEIAKIQEFYSGRQTSRKKEDLSDLVRKSAYLVYVPGIKQLSGFSEVEKITEFVQNSLITGQIVVFKKVPSRIDVKLELE
jgi:hypothetical protein